jgi:hypothetical protein
VLPGVQYGRQCAAVCEVRAAMYAFKHLEWCVVSGEAQHKTALCVCTIVPRRHGFKPTGKSATFVSPPGAPGPVGALTLTSMARAPIKQGSGDQA